MSRAATTVFVHGLYLIALSLTLLAVPDVALGLVGLPAHKDVFIYVAAMLVLFLGGFFVVAARNEVTDFFRLSVATRFSVPIFLGAFVLLAQAKVNLMIFAVPDVLLAVWTLLSLRAAAQPVAAGMGARSSGSSR